MSPEPQRITLSSTQAAERERDCVSVLDEELPLSRVARDRVAANQYGDR
jgi:hypothetical protein